MVGGFYLRYVSLPPPKTFARYWDGRIVSAEVGCVSTDAHPTVYCVIVAHPCAPDCA